MHQHACHGKNKTIHSSPHVDHCKNILDDWSIKVGGGQHITTLDKHKTYVCIRRALPYILLYPNTDKEWITIPHIMVTSDIDWDPTCLDCEGQVDNEEWFDDQFSLPDGTDSKLFNECGDHRIASKCHELHFFDTEKFKEGTRDDVIGSFLSFNKASTKRKEPEYSLLQPLLIGFLST